MTKGGRWKEGLKITREEGTKRHATERERVSDERRKSMCERYRKKGEKGGRNNLEGKMPKEGREEGRMRKKPGTTSKERKHIRKERKEGMYGRKEG